MPKSVGSLEKEPSELEISFIGVHTAAGKLNWRFKMHAKQCPICQLPESIRDMLELRWFRGQSNQDIVTWLKTSTDNIISVDSLTKHFDILVASVSPAEIKRIQKLVTSSEALEKERERVGNRVQIATQDFIEDTHLQTLTHLGKIRKAQAALAYDLWTKHVPKLAILLLKKIESIDENTSLREAAHTFDLLTKTAQLLAGKPTMRVETTPIDDIQRQRTEKTSQSLQLRLQALQQANNVLELKKIEAR